VPVRVAAEAFVTPQKALVLLLALGSLCGCATEPDILMATPLMYRDERLNIFAQLPERHRNTNAEVFYATRRAPVPQGEPGHYGKDPSESVRLGVSQIELGEPGWTFEQLVDSDRTSSVEHPRPGRVLGVSEFASEGDFIAAIDAHIAGSNNKAVAVYVHGYRVAFDEVEVMMGSLSVYLSYGATVSFQWPTGLNWWNYLTDCPRARQYVPDIAHLIEVLDRTKAEFINVLSFSCGTPLVAEALALLRARHPDEDRAALARRYRIGNVVFAASDIDLKTFAREYVPAMMDLPRQTTVYISRRDAALGWSSLVAGVSRLGKPSIDDLTVEDIERLAANPNLQAVDVTDVRGAHEIRGMSGHGYWYANEWIANDVLLSLRYPIPPARRCLVPGRPGSRIWEMPDNYADCVVNDLIRNYPQLQRQENLR
jgi:esterase/lipase superfamily enzyme